MKRTAHHHYITETLDQLKAGATAKTIVLNKTIGTLRDCCVEWMVNGYSAINDPALVRKVSTTPLDIMHPSTHAQLIRPGSFARLLQTPTSTSLMKA